MSSCSLASSDNRVPCALSLIMESLSDLIDHILVEAPLKVMDKVAAVLALLNEILKVFLGGLHIFLLPVMEHLVEYLVLLRAKASLFLSSALSQVIIVLNLLVYHLILELFACFFLDNHLADDLCIDCLLISDHRVLEVLGLSPLDILINTELVLKSFPSTVHSTGHLISQFDLVGIIWS